MSTEGSSRFEQGSSITDELREWWVHRFPVMDKKLHDDFTAIADRIDEQAERESEAAWRRGYERGEDEAEFEDLDELRKEVQADWVPLPKDADGVPIRIGDRVRIGRTEFEAIGFGNVTCDEETYGVFMQRESGEYEWFNARYLRHYHAPTVEDVLREFANKVCSSDHLVKDGTFIGLEDTDLLAEYAAKLRLAGGE